MGSPNIGLKQASRLTQINDADRLNFFAEGLPHLLASAQGFSKASESLREGSREADVLTSLAMEEAAKILVILDIVRCPPKRRAQQIGRLLKPFYSHLARLIYAEAAGWNAVDLFELRRYVDIERRAHYVDGPISEYIFPNSILHKRESRMYVDIETYEDGKPFWSFPTDTEFHFSASQIPSLQVAEALGAVGVFSESGLNIVSDVWATKDFCVEEPSFNESPLQHHEAQRLVRLMLDQLDAVGLVQQHATQGHVASLLRNWQLPMYDLEFELIKVSLEELEAQRDAAYWSEVGVGWGGY